MPPDTVASGAADNGERMTPLELRASLSLAAIFGLRLLGMFVILPVFALYAAGLPGWDKTWIGIALGAYGLTQAALQIPFGWLSDRFGRKPVMYVGLAIFASGSFVCAMSTSVLGIVAGRMLQGAGAVSSVAVATAGDLTRPSQRTKAMAMIGMTIGLAFALSFVLSPFLSSTIGVAGIFALTGVLAVVAMFVVYRIVPEIPVTAKREPVKWGRILGDQELLRLNFGIFVLHAILMAMFVVVPFRLTETGLAAPDHWMLYLGVFVLSLVFMVPFVRGERGRSRGVFVGAVGVLTLALLMLALLQHSLLGIAASLLVFFAAFNILEAALPAMVTLMAPEGARGSATGVYASVQFFGVFAGGAAGGVLSQYAGGDAVLWISFACALVWWLAALGMRQVGGGQKPGGSDN
jgi:MFS family permease